MNLKKSSEMLGKNYYRILYQTELEEEAEWLRRGAAEKVNSIEILLNRNTIKPKIILELGCGIGAVITECQRRSLATNYIGVDYAPEAIDYLRKHTSGIKSIQGDITDSNFNIGDTCDVIVVSHVIEHMEKPATFLATMKKSFRPSCVIIEVPLEDLVAGKMKSILWDRTANSAGHVQFFTARTFEHLLSSNGFKIIDRRTYVPILDMDTIRFVSDKDGLSRYRRLLKVFTNNYLLRILNPLWKRLYYAHYAVLCIVDH
jgi:SAM-dependent methyltransferase